MLDSHPDVAVPPEAQFVRHLAPGGPRSRGDFSVDSFLDLLFEHERFRLWQLPRHTVEASFRERRPESYADAVRTLFALYASRSGKTRYADKTPENVEHLPLLAGLFPEARFVHLIRDGRDVALSFLATEFALGGIEEAAFAWRKAVDRARRAARHLPPSRYLEIRYEDLVTDPETTARSVAHFLDLPYDGAMLTYPQRADDLLQGVSYPSAHQHLRLAPTKGLRDWRREMSRDDLVTFELIAGRLLGRLGYERTVQTASFLAMARRLGLEGRRSVRRARMLLRRVRRGLQRVSLV